MDLAPLIAGSGVAYLFAALMMVFLYREERSPHMAWWAAAFGVSAIRQIFALGVQVLDPRPYYAAAIYIAVIISGVFLLRGTFALIDRRFSPALYWVAGITAAWTLAAPFVTESFYLFSLPAFLLRGICDIVAGIVVLRYLGRSVGSVFTGATFIIWGLHRFNYPFLRYVDWFAPWGFELSSVLGISVAMGMLAVHYERTRADLARREEEYRGLFENAAFGLIRTDLKGRILDANPALVELLGYDSREEVLKLSMAEDVYATPEDRQRLMDAHLQDEVLEGIRLNWRRRDGSVRTVQLVARQFRIDGEVTFEASVYDVTTEQELQGQLNAARQMEALGRLAGGVAHDFNNMLTAIIGSAQMARLEASDGKVPVEELDPIEVAATQASALSRQLLAFSRRDVEEPQPLQFDNAVGNAAALLERLIPKTVALEVEREAFDRVIFTQPGQLERLVINLAVNANEAMRGVGRLTIKTWVEGDDVVLEVRDDGGGMTESTVARIFEPFFTTDPKHGVGLGLANVKEIVDTLGGSIDVESVVGDGSAFVVRLPSVRQSSSADDHVAPLRKTQVEPRLILLVEDTAIVREQLARYLEWHGFDLLVASDGAEALKLAIQQLDDIDLIVTDVVMPKMTGPELINELKKDRDDLPFLYMSGYTETALANEGVPLERFIPKPFKPNELVERIEQLLGGR